MSENLNDYELFGKKITEFRKKRFMTQTDLASALNISRVSLNQYEKGTRKVPLSFITKVANYFNITVDELIGIETPTEESNINPYIKFMKELVALNLTSDELKELCKYATFIVHNRGDK